MPQLPVWIQACADTGSVSCRHMPVKTHYWHAPALHGVTTLCRTAVGTGGLCGMQNRMMEVFGTASASGRSPGTCTLQLLLTHSIPVLC
jgi:hypothetical protein